MPTSPVLPGPLVAAQNAGLQNSLDHFLPVFVMQNRLQWAGGGAEVGEEDRRQESEAEVVVKRCEMKKARRKAEMVAQKFQRL